MMKSCVILLNAPTRYEMRMRGGFRHGQHRLNANIQNREEITPLTKVTGLNDGRQFRAHSFLRFGVAVLHSINKIRPAQRRKKSIDKFRFKPGDR